MVIKNISRFLYPFVGVIALVFIARLSWLPSTAANHYNCAAQTDIPKIECEALIAIYHANPNGNFDSSWLVPNSSPCSWAGITCTNGFVTHIQSSSLSWKRDTYFRLTSLPPEIDNLNALSSLGLNNNFLTSLPPEIGNLSALSSLGLSSNLLTSIPPEVGNLNKLSSLYLSHNQLSSIPSAIGNLSNLSTLDVSRNWLSTIPPELSNLSLNGLFARLDLSHNQLTVLPANFGNLSLSGWGTSVSLNHNQLISLPESFGNLPADTISLHNNQLISLPESFGNLPADIISLRNNQLTSLPESFGNLSIHDLNLSHNQLIALPESISSLSINKLDLSHNQLASLPNSFDSLPVSDLILHSNPLTGTLPSPLLFLNLTTFSFYDTGWCIPNTPIYESWLTNIDELIGTGHICGQSGGTINGRVILTDTTPISNTMVALYRTTFPFRKELITTTLTDEEGYYQFDELGQGIDYFVNFAYNSKTYFPEYYPDMPSLDTATPITISLGTTTEDIDATLIYGVFRLIPVMGYP